MTVWSIIDGPRLAPPPDPSADLHRFQFLLTRPDWPGIRRLAVHIPGSSGADDVKVDRLREAIETDGLTAVEALLDEETPPVGLTVRPSGIARWNDHNAER